MPLAADTALAEELRRAGLPGRGPLPRLLALLRAEGETHLPLSAVARLAERAAIAPAELPRLLDALVARGLLGRVPGTAEPLFDTVTEPHSHIVYDDTAQTVDLHVSPETLVEILRRTLAERPGEVEVLVRVRGAATPR
ncbi:hypothetical protein ACI6QG_03655 [Roseococcus sp. DSY-14]|uniref:hypothetical protein n=1 Tax=Roseococcus sp. DSY-14 TaxID=3369650 RepID=UPI00387A991A